MIYKFKEFVNEKYNKGIEYVVGDIVMIRYWLSGDIVPVKIIAKPSHNNYIISFKVDGSAIFNAADQEIKGSDIIGKQVAPIQTIQNPKLKPVISGMVPGWDSWNNDISI